MNIFGKRRQRVQNQNDLQARITALEEYIDYMTEQTDYGFRQVEKRLPPQPSTTNTNSEEG